jgi:hypothetical protein
VHAIEDLPSEVLSRIELLDRTEIIKDRERRSDPNHAQTASKRKPSYYRQLNCGFASFSTDHD